jgi:hypothetical protein
MRPARWGTMCGMTVIDWLVDSDPAIGWQVMRDLTDAPAEEVAAERIRVFREGWGAQILASQARLRLRQQVRVRPGPHPRGPGAALPLELMEVVRGQADRCERENDLLVQSPAGVTGGGYLRPVPVLKRTTRSSPARKPDATRCEMAANVAAPSGAA